MKTLLAVLAVAALAGACRRKIPQVEETKVDNAATRYTTSLQNSVDKAQAVTDKANAALKQRQGEAAAGEAQ